MSILTYADFEYRSTSEPNLEVVCCALLVRDNGVETLRRVFWLHNSPADQKTFTDILLQLHAEGAYFLSYNVIAEAGAILSMGVDCTEWRWIDLLLEVKQIRNGNYSRLYGKYVDKHGNKKTSYPPLVDERGRKVELEKGDTRKKNNSKTNIDLTSTLWGFLGIEPQLQHKHEMRDIILRGNYTEEERYEIVKYAASDVVELPNLFKLLQEEIRKLTRQTFAQYLVSALVRGEWSARLAKMERIGMPVDRARLERVALSREAILDEWINMLCDKHFPFYEKDKKGKWTFKDEKKQEFVKLKGFESTWGKSKKTGKFSYASEVLGDFEELCPEIKELSRIRNFDSQSKSYNAAVSKFIPTSILEEQEDEESVEGKETIFNRIGADGRLRCYFNPYGTKTGRNASPARNFLLAQAKWLRSSMRPPSGWCYTSIDYAAEEFIIAACESKDENMMAAYDKPTGGGSPDVYLNFAVIAGACPPTATKKTHGPMRTQFKSTVLGKQFGMGVAKLHRKLIADTGRKDFPLEEAEELDRIHKETFADYWAWSRETIDRYADGEPLCTRDGWYLFCDDPNMMAVGNFPIQGAGGAILRRAVRYGQQQGIRIVAPLHDACYILHKEDETHHISIMKECMNRAFQDFYGRDIRMDSKTWKHDDEFIEEGALHTFSLLAKYFMSESEYAHWPLMTNIIS